MGSRTPKGPDGSDQPKKLMGRLLYAGTPQKRPGCDTPLQTWIDSDRRLSYNSIGKQIKICAATIRHWAQGKVLPPLVHAFKLELISGGAVPVVAWLITDIAKEMWRVEHMTADEFYERRQANIKAMWHIRRGKNKTYDEQKSEQHLSLSERP